ncbi:MAG: YceI family protein [Lentisphaerae bacterium]|nr:YceI family protein [Lentisphaerota bacterium]
MKRRMMAWTVAATLAVATGLRAAAAEFDFEDPKGVNGIQILLDTPLEPIAGVAGGVSGKVTFDPAAPEKTTGFIEVKAAEIAFVNPMMTKVAQGADWLGIDVHPDIRFDVVSVLEVRKGGGDGRFVLRVKGDFECRGVKKPLVVDVDVHHMPGRMGERVQKSKGDLLALRASFGIKRTDFGLKKDLDFLHVADEVQVRFGIVGHAPTP